MTPTGQTVCLCMIVKDEAPVIRRCLDSVRPLVDRWLIVDTGSTDGTQAIVRGHCADLPGELVERPWRDFAHNRSEALALARSTADYSLVIDADDTFTVPPGFAMPVLDADSYTVDIRDGGITYGRAQLVSNALPWRYRGVLHEFLACDEAKTAGHLALVMNRNHDGARRRDGATYRKDAAILERALKGEADPFLASRYTFYLAQSYRDSGQPRLALKHYLARAALGFWDEEVFVALLNAARLKEGLGHPVEEVLSAYERAAASRPTRAEALHGASRLCRLKDRFAEGAALARRGLAIPKPSGALFLEDWVYDYGLDDELSISAYWSGRYEESLDAGLRMLASGRCPAGERERAEANVAFARRKVAEAAGAAEAARGPLKIAVYTIALDEAAHVERWTRSTAGADYRVVADTGSRDGTAALLDAAGVTVHRIAVRPWRFDDARNACLALVPGDADVCISLDMDEFLMDGWRAAVEAAWRPGTTRLFYSYARGFKPDGSPASVFRRGKAHSRSGYRWKRIVHEDLERFTPGEAQADTPALIMGEVQDLGKDRTNYLPLLERAHEDDPRDAQICFWYARDLMYAGRDEDSAAVYLRYLDLPTATWADERAEAMRYLARVRPAQKLPWLQKAIAEAPHRRELWLDLAEHHHSELSWPDLYWACTNGITRCRATGSYLDESAEPGYRLYDLGALACFHIGLADKAVEWGARAAELCPGDGRLASNLTFFKARRDGRRPEGPAAGSASASVYPAVERAINANGQRVALGEARPGRRDFRVCAASPPGYVHAAALVEIAQFVVSGLEHLGHRVSFTAEPGRAPGCDIIVGGHLLTAEQCGAVRDGAVVYNSEHTESDFFKPEAQFYLPHYIDLLRRAKVWDYSRDNSEALARTFGIRARYVPLGYVPTLTRIGKGEEDIDVLFYGSPCERRQAILDALSARGLRVHSVFGVYGRDRDALIARSKVVLNIHKNMPGTFEIVRIAHLLANMKAVVGEVNPGEHLDSDLRDGFAGVPYGGIVEAAAALVADDARRKALEKEGFRRFSSRNASLILGGALGG